MGFQEDHDRRQDSYREQEHKRKMKKLRAERANTLISLIAGIVAVVVIGGVIVGGCVVQPKWRVYSQTKEGEARLRRSETEKKIRVQDALAVLESAKALAAAESTRAHGVAQANAIIGESLKNNEAYLRWLYVNQLGEMKDAKQIIYIPTEAGVPILEAGKRR